jgi:hypothetical protein
MGRFDDPVLKRAVFERDRWRCRWCGRTNAWAYDCHHIRYRRSSEDDVMENLITLCRDHHNFVHDSSKIPKQEAQEILFELIERPGVTGIALRRVREARIQREREGKEAGASL